MATRLNLRDRARARADQDSATFPTDTQYNAFLDSAAQEVWYDLIQAGWPVSFTSVTKTATGVQLLPLGVSGVAFVRGVFRLDGTTYTELRRLNEGDRAGLMSSPSSGQATQYSIVIDPTNGVCLELLPVPSAGSYRVDYVAEFAGFANDAATWFGPARSDELIVIRAAVKGCRKEDNEQAARALLAEYAELFEKVTNMASWLDMRNSAKIRDVGDAAFGMPRRDAFDFDV